MMKRMRRSLGGAAGRVYRSVSRPRGPVSVERVLASARRTMRAKTYCLMITSAGGGTTSRVVQAHHVDVDEFVVHLGTDPASRKVSAVLETGRCQLVYERDSHRCCVVLDCTVEVLRGEEAGKHFLGVWKAFWPQGPDDSFVALRCRAQRIEVWDGRHGVAPPPFGRRSAHLARHSTGWRFETDQRKSGLETHEHPSTPKVPAAVTAWHELAERAQDHPAQTKSVRTLIEAMIAEDVVFCSPVVFSPQEGREVTTAYLEAAMAVLGPTVRYDRELYGDDSAVLEFHADLDGTQVHGIDFLRWGSDARLIEITVMVRPHRGLEVLTQKMADQLFS